MIFEIKDTSKVEGIFSGWQETMIWSCVQGVMGKIYADSADNPKSAMAVIGDFCFFAGSPDGKLISFQTRQSGRDFAIMVPRTSDWHPIIEDICGNNAKKVTRYAIKKEADIFDPEKLKMFVSMLPKDFSLKMIDKEIYDCCLKESWSRDFVSLYKDYTEYSKIGLGVVVIKDGKIVSGASSYSSYRNGIEIEIDTKEGYRRKGLATVCGARLILECINRGLYPSWDAHNPWSVALAEKLGYHFDYEYTAYETIATPKGMQPQDKEIAEKS